MSDLADGIYFNMPEEVYHALPRLSVSGMQKLLISPATFWASSWLNPALAERDEEATKAQLLGRAYHCARLEPDQLKERFVRALDKSDMPDGTLFTGSEMGAALASLGEPKTKAGESVLDQARRLQAAYLAIPVPPDPPALWHIALAEWEEFRGDRTPIPGKYWDEIEADMAVIRATPEISSLLSDGYAEVSVLWHDEQNIPMRARLDYIRVDGWADFKSFANPMGKHLEQCIADAFIYNRYNVQAAGYREAFEAIMSAQRELRVHGSVEQLQFIEEIRQRDDDPECHYVFQEKGGIPNLLAKSIRFFEVPLNTTAQHAGATEAQQAKMDKATQTPSAWLIRSRREIRKAKRIFRAYSEIYAEGEPWRPFNPIGELSDLSFSTFWLDAEIGE